MKIGRLCYKIGDFWESWAKTGVLGCEKNQIQEMPLVNETNLKLPIKARISTPTPKRQIKSAIARSVYSNTIDVSFCFFSISI